MAEAPCKEHKHDMSNGLNLLHPRKDVAEMVIVFCVSLIVPEDLMFAIKSGEHVYQESSFFVLPLSFLRVSWWHQVSMSWCNCSKITEVLAGAHIAHHKTWLHHMTLGTGGSPGVDMVDATHEVGGVGWGGDDNVLCTCTHGWCYATSCFLHLHTWLVLRNIMFLALAHMVGATQHHVSCTCTHGWCYATSCFLHLHTWSVLRNIMFLALAHMVGATQHHVLSTVIFWVHTF